jgi:hypothetical protein
MYSLDKKRDNILLVSSVFPYWEVEVVWNYYIMQGNISYKVDLCTHLTHTYYKSWVKLIIQLLVNLCQKLFFLQNKGRTCCVQKLFWMSETISVHNRPRFELGIFMYWTCNSMNNLWSYFGLVDSKIRASDKDLPVSCMITQMTQIR